MAPPLPLAAAASRLAGPLDPAAAPPRSGPMPPGMRALLAAVAPYAATSRVLLLDAAATSRVAAACRAALLGDQTASAARLSVLNSAAALGASATPTPDASSTPTSATGAGILSVLSAAAGLDASATPTLDASSTPTLDASSTHTSGSGIGIGRLLTALAPHAAASRGLLLGDAATAATTHFFSTVIGAASDPRFLFSTAATCFDPCKTTAALVFVDTASASPVDTYPSASMTLAAPRSHHLFNRNAHQLILTRSISTTTKMSSKAGARAARPKLKPAPRTRHQSIMFKSLDYKLRMSHFVRFSNRNTTRLFTLFALFTITSQGVEQFRLRIEQASAVLGSLDSMLWLQERVSNILGSLELELQEREGTKGWIELVSIVGEDFGWVE